MMEGAVCVCRCGRMRIGRLQTLRDRTPPYTQLQVLLRRIGLHDRTRGAHGQTQRPADLTHHYCRPDVRSPDLSVSARVVRVNAQALMPSAITAGHRTIHKRRGNVIQLRLIYLQLCTLAPVLQDNRDLMKNQRTGNCQILWGTKNGSFISINPPFLRVYSHASIKSASSG
uniref:Uncharacterized protein n=1 Tax=Sinocyclocheilus rhinocerous TaxID=307959 RepID=A0A673MMN1_9TELE